MRRWAWVVIVVVVAAALVAGGWFLAGNLVQSSGSGQCAMEDQPYPDAPCNDTGGPP